MPNNEYLKLFNARVIVLETLGGPLPIHPKLVTAKLVLMGLMGTDLECLKPNHQYKKAVISAQNEYLALFAISGANITRFSSLKDKLENESLLGHSNYPKNQAEFLHIMNKYKPEVARIQRNHQKNTEDLAFIQA